MAMRLRSIFGRWYSLGETQQAFNQALRTPRAAAFVVPELAEFCAAGRPFPRDGDLYKLGIAAGRMDVWLHIREMLDLTEDELADVYRGRSYFQGVDNGLP